MYCKKCQKYISEENMMFTKRNETICKSCNGLLFSCELDNSETITPDMERSKPKDNLDDKQTKKFTAVTTTINQNGEAIKVIDQTRTRGRGDSRESAKREIRKIAEAYSWGSNIQNNALLIYEAYKCQKEKEIKNRPMKIIAAASLFMANQLITAQENYKREKGSSKSRFDNSFIDLNAQKRAMDKGARKHAIPLIMQNWLTPDEQDYYQKIGDKLVNFSSEISVRNGTKNSNPFLKQLKDISTHVKIDAMITTEDYLKQCTTIFGFSNLVTDYNLEIYRRLKEKTEIKEEATLKNSALVIELLRGILEELNPITKVNMPQTETIAAMLSQSTSDLRNLADYVNRNHKDIINDVKEKIELETGIRNDKLGKLFYSRNVMELNQCRANTKEIRDTEKGLLGIE